MDHSPKGFARKHRLHQRGLYLQGESQFPQTFSLSLSLSLSLSQSPIIPGRHSSAGACGAWPDLCSDPFVLQFLILPSGTHKQVHVKRVYILELSLSLSLSVSLSLCLACSVCACACACVCERENLRAAMLSYPLGL